MEKGITKSLYVKPAVLKFCRRLTELAGKEGSSFSDAVNDAIKQAYYQKRTKVWISPGAYLAIANGQLEVLECVRTRNDGIDLMLRKDAPALAHEGQDNTFPDIDKNTSYSIGEGMLQDAMEPEEKNHNIIIHQ